MLTRLPLSFPFLCSCPVTEENKNDTTKVFVQDILNKILKINPKERLTINDIKSHPWFNLCTPHLIKGISLKDTIIPVDNKILEMEKENSRK